MESSPLRTSTTRTARNPSRGGGREREYGGVRKLRLLSSALILITICSIFIIFETGVNHIVDEYDDYNDDISIHDDSNDNNGNENDDNKNDDNENNDKENNKNQIENSKKSQKFLTTEFVEAKVKARPTKQNEKQMNILILYPDDWRHDSLGSEKPYILTPFLNQLAKEGIRFTQNAVTTSVCWMSRATLWMGQYSSRHKSYKLKCPRMALPHNWDHSWVRILQKVGYYVGHTGKWQYYTKDTHSLFDWGYVFEGNHWEEVFGGRKIHASDLAKEKAFQFLDLRPKDKPFALSVAFYPPKPIGWSNVPGQQWFPTNETRKLYNNVTIPEPVTPNEAHSKLPEFLQGDEAAGTSRYKVRYVTSEHYQASMKNYYALITGVDQACKEIVDRLKKDGLYNNTMIIFTTDNGMFHGSHGLGGKWYPYQESIRVPLIIYDPRMPAEKVGTLDDSFTLNIDLAETILGAAGVKPDNLMQGRDISDLYLPNNIKDDYHSSLSVKSEAWREEFFYEFPSPDELYIPSSTALVRKDWKYIYWPKHNREQLFNLKDDPLEFDDLYNNTNSNIVDVMNRMRERHDELKEELHDTSYSNDVNTKCDKFLDEHDI